MIKYLKGVRAEIKKIKWPTRKQVQQYTIIVIVFSLAVAFFLGGLDFIFTYILNTFFI